MGGIIHVHSSTIFVGGCIGFRTLFVRAVEDFRSFFFHSSQDELERVKPLKFWLHVPTPPRTLAGKWQ